MDKERGPQTPPLKTADVEVGVEHVTAVTQPRTLPDLDGITHAFKLVDGNPTGGSSMCLGMVLSWQDGPLRATEGTPARGLNGVVPEEVATALLYRLQFLNKHMPCRENSLAITKLEECLHWLAARRRDRVSRGVADTYQR